MLGEFGALLRGTSGDAGYGTRGIPAWAQSMIGDPTALMIGGIIFAILIYLLVFRR
ncbi:MAG: hypothetical protein JXR14_09560 [Paracoccaceae bacterium]